MLTIEQQIEDLREHIKEKTARLRELEAEHFEETILPAMRANVGQCFKFRNSYSCPSSESDYWWMHLKIVGVRDGCYRMLAFQIDHYGKFSIEEHCPSTLTGSYQPIPRVEFMNAVLPMLEKLRLEVEHDQ